MEGGIYVIRKEGNRQMAAVIRHCDGCAGTHVGIIHAVERARNGVYAPLVGRSIGAVAVHEVIPNGFDVILVRENLPFFV